MCIHIHICIHTYVFILHIHIYIHTYTYIHIYTYIYVLYECSMYVVFDVCIRSFSLVVLRVLAVLLLLVD